METPRMVVGKGRGEWDFGVEALQTRLAGRGIGHRFLFLSEVDSTNRLALQLAREGAPEGTVVLADRQTKGRGRLQRSWQSPPGCNLYASFLLRPAIAPADAPRITLMAGVAVAEMVSCFCTAGVGLKWPNDVRIRGRKVSGILAEMTMNAEAVEAVVVGIGVNVNMAGADFDPAYREAATSLREETGKTFDRGDAAFLLCQKMEQWYQILLREGFEPVRSRWLALTEMKGSLVRVRFQSELQEGTFAGIDGDGALLLADAPGSVRRITAGDASIVKG
ncbi:MAG: biotin--[acetyl-CoA-carboxylase] ligase [Thermodesulfobacteriota bacterium]